jgi:elongation factor Ts
MSDVSAELVKRLREMTGAPLMDCKKALVEAGGDIERAVRVLREKGQTVLSKREGKAANEGAIISYIHTGDKIGVMLELNCETDFVAKTQEFRTLGHDIAMQIAWSNPEYISRDAVPPEAVEKEREIHVTWAKNQGKPEKAIDNIVKGKMEKFYEEVCLMDQPFIRDSDLKVRDVFNEVVGKLGEKIVLKRFIRFRVGEGNAEGPSG